LEAASEAAQRANQPKVQRRNHAWRDGWRRLISDYSRIGKNFKIWQGCTVGIKGGDGEKSIIIGDDVSLCVNSCVIGDVISIADNVVIGAMTLVNKDISHPGTYINKRALDRFSCGDALPISVL
jgi:acetyltransferase-like isoleucine patch superfamily enzyme